MISEQEILNASILIVDDQPSNVRLLAEMLREATIVVLPRPVIPMKFARCTKKTATT